MSHKLNPTSPERLINLSEVKDKGMQAILRNLTRMIADLHIEVARIVNLNADELTALDTGITDLTTLIEVDWKGVTPGGRLSTITANPIAVNTNSTSLYYVPYLHGIVPLYDTTASLWIPRALSGTISITNSGLSVSSVYDVFLYWTGTAIAIELVAWSSTTARATSLVDQDNIRVKSGDASRRYIGTIYVNAAGQFTDTLLNRGVWNYYNRVVKSSFSYFNSSSWTYSTAAWRNAGGSANNAIFLVCGAKGSEQITMRANAVVGMMTDTANLTGFMGIGYDSTTTTAHGSTTGAQTRISPAAINTMDIGSVDAEILIDPGFHTLYLLEYGAGSGVQSWAGRPSGIAGGIGGLWEC